MHETVQVTNIYLCPLASTSLPLRESFYGSLPNRTILLDNLVCTGEEENLLQCSRVPQLNIGESDCTLFEDAGVRCEGRKIIYFYF